MAKMVLWYGAKHLPKVVKENIYFKIYFFSHGDVIFCIFFAKFAVKAETSKLFIFYTKIGQNDVI